ncbi:MAG: hypothetical protein HC802_14310 [Caldilineaceae bacterium]|nr:hypothetical protein [Caldilineaceae bacterium]
MRVDEPHLHPKSQQQALRDRCRHPSGHFVPFLLEEIETSVAACFEQQATLFPQRVAVVVGRPDGRGDHRLVAYYVANGAAPSIGWLRNALAKRCRPI